MSARVLSAMVVLLFCTGCALPMLSGTSPQPPPGCTMCEVPCDYHTALKLAVAYITKSYPSQGIAGLDREDLNSQPGVVQTDIIWRAGEWIIEDHGAQHRCADIEDRGDSVGRVTVTNTVTGFCWEGNVFYYCSPPDGSCCNGRICSHIVEAFVANLTPSIPNPRPTEEP
jgi:hypothetical protein